MLPIRKATKQTEIGPLRQKLEWAFLHGVRAYTFNTPFAKGKYRAFMTALDLCRSIPEPEIVSTNDGRRLWADLSTGMHEGVFFLGEYERAITELTKLLVQAGNICFDVGANFGWYTTLFHKLTGPLGEVHAFEPVPSTFDELIRNYELNSDPPLKRVRLNNLALGNEAGAFKVNLFSDLTTGHASLSDQGRTDATSFDCRAVTLDSYLEENSIRKVDFVKVDIEGSELNFLKGAGSLFNLASPPFILMEMALNTARNFGYVPNELVRFIGSHAPYQFFTIEEKAMRLEQIDGLDRDDAGANVLCIPETRSELLLRLSGWF